MQIHNLMQDYVIKMTEDIFKEEASSQFCTSYQCKLDVICYVLNRVKPEYVISGRGLAHHESKYSDKLQKEADVNALIREAMHIVTNRQRPTALNKLKDKPPIPHGVFYNFPSIMGRIFNGTNFAPITDVKISLKYKGKLLRSIDENWCNPYEMVSSTAGTYTFWPYPIEGDQPGHKKTFSFELTVEDPRYEPLYHYFDLKISAKNEFIDFFQIDESYVLKDLLLFPSE